MKRGSALIIVLWVVALLSVLIGGFAFDMHVEAKIVSYLRKRLKAEYLSKAGLEYAQALLIHSQEIKGKGDSEEMKGKYWYNEARQLRQGHAIMGLKEKLGEGVFVLDIFPEGALRNINALKEEDWELIFEMSHVPSEKWPELIDCLNDWRDPDDEVSKDGAETDDYYARLDPPYKARGHRATGSKDPKRAPSDKMANLDTVEELLLIKGWNDAILYGGYEEEGETNTTAMTGIIDLLTASPDAGEQVNINAATKRVLMTLPGIDDTLAEAIITERNKGDRQGLTGTSQIDEDSTFKGMSDLFSRVPELSRLKAEDQQRLKTLGGTASSVLRVRSSGVVQGVEYRMTSTLGAEPSKNGAPALRK